MFGEKEGRLTFEKGRDGPSLHGHARQCVCEMQAFYCYRKELKMSTLVAERIKVLTVVLWDCAVMCMIKHSRVSYLMHSLIFIGVFKVYTW